MVHTSIVKIEFIVWKILGLIFYQSDFCREPFLKCKIKELRETFYAIMLAQIHKIRILKVEGSCPREILSLYRGGDD